MKKKGKKKNKKTNPGRKASKNSGRKIKTGTVKMMEEKK